MKIHFTKALLTLLYIILYIGAAAAQTRATTKITGTLIDADGKPMEYATISLLKAKDSTIVKGSLSTDAGVYIFAAVSPGTYLLKATAVGYNKTVSAPFTVNGAELNITAPVLKMADNTKSLKTVNIVTTKPLIERKIDRTVMNVENSILAAGNSAMEILERAPGVTIDKDDNISLNGKQGVTVMINDRLTYLSAAQLATLLRSTDGTTIESIELITNPSSKYDASGNSGMINIKLKKSKEAGTNGSATVGAGMGNYFKDNESISLNHKDGKLNIFGSFSHNDNQRSKVININRDVTGINGQHTFFEQSSFMPEISHNNGYRAGADYDLSSKNTIGIIVNGYFNTDNDFNNNPTRIGSSPATVDSLQYTRSSFRQTFNDFAANLNDRYQLTKSGQVLTADVDYSKFRNNDNDQYQTDYFLADGATQHPSSFLRNQSPSTINIHTGKIDYVNPISKTLKLESGLKYSDVKTDNDLEAQILTNSAYVNDTTRTNRFVYDEKISAAYVNISKDYKNTSVQFGLRGEYTNSTGDLINTNEIVNRKYFNLFPSLYINHNFNDKNQLGFSYSRRVDRPSYANLNPFIQYLDPYTYEQGNPFLKPQYTNKYEFNYGYNKTINVTAGYSQTKDAITQILLTDVVKKATFETTLNLQTQNSYYVNINSPYTIAKWFTGNINVNGFYNQFKSDGILGANLNKGQAAYNAKVTQSFLFSGFRAEILENYQSAQTYGLFEIKPQYNIDLGLSRSFAAKKMNVKLSVSDIFNTRRNDVDINYQTDIDQIRQHNESRIARLTLTYNFGNSKLKARNHQSGAEDEKGRVKGAN